MISPWQRPHFCMISSLKPSASARVIVCALWQSLQTGSCLSVLPSSAWWMLFSNCSWIPWWQRPQVCGTFLRLTLESGSVRGSTAWAVWQPVQVAVTVRPLFSRPLPWMLSV